MQPLSTICIPETMPGAGATYRALKALDPRRKIIMTGTYAVTLPERTMREETIDSVCDLQATETIL